MKAYVGVDWSASEIVCATSDALNEPRRIAGARRDFASVQDFMERVRRRHPDAEQVCVVIEAGAPGWVQMLHHTGAIVYVVDSKQARAFAESLSSSGAKDDGRDSIVLALLGQERCHRLESWKPGAEQHTHLRELASLHESRTRECTAETQRLRAYLRERFPELESELKSLQKYWVFTLLRAVPTAYHAAQMTRADFDELMRGSRARATTLDRIWECLQRAEAPWLTEETAQSQAFAIRLMVDELEHRYELVRQLEERLDEATQGMQVRSLLESVGGISTKMANRLIELVFGDDPPRDRDSAAIRLGASPVFRGSGKSRTVRMRRSASPRARATAYLLGRLASQQLAWARARYGYDRSNGKSAAESYRRIARSLLRILTAMHKSGEPYDDARYTAALQQKGVPWAMGIACGP